MFQSSLLTNKKNLKIRPTLKHHWNLHYCQFLNHHRSLSYEFQLVVGSPLKIGGHGLLIASWMVNAPTFPTSYKDAINCSNAEKWILAIKDEYDSLMENKTWSIMTCPKGRQPIKSRWVFDIKPAVQAPTIQGPICGQGFQSTGRS
ncbi:hypothetical protein DAPPUDRAFT_258972 [Daphnia pulex]|uniref:Reverse transcriptase Ty1/copia-type domain-containing protein n=1 Tax=Daphnia pulex TaxID=6669 RepID=E9HGC3_DAPPU|nr:hypothetical protein DAPPUDRAFT_258972 [Daphnia pulex]|eukprot:EFX69199.1 hypothetical protein DAPPUDRAFT_258972 [Daphnia pulex]